MRVLPEPERHPQVRLTNHELAHLATYRLTLFVEDRGIDAGNGTGETPGSRRRQDVSRHQAAAALRASRVIDDRDLCSADDLKEPGPGFGGPRFSGRSQDAQRGDRRGWHGAFTGCH